MKVKFILPASSHPPNWHPSVLRRNLPQLKRTLPAKKKECGVTDQLPQLHSALYRGSALVSFHQAQPPEMLLTQLWTTNKSRSNIINREAARGITVHREQLFRQTQQISPMRKPKASIVTVDPYRSCQLFPQSYLCLCSLMSTAWVPLCNLFLPIPNLHLATTAAIL